MFKKAERKQAKLRLALSGPSGSGKTTGALLIAKGIGGRIAVLDTERGSASLYSDRVPFDVVELGAPYAPERFIEVIKAAEAEGYDTLILDSITHEWNGSGGVLEIVDALARTKYRGNSYAAWNEGTPRHQKFLDAMLASRLHIIATMRSKAAYLETENEKGKKVIQKVGMAPQQRDGLEYEFTSVLDLSNDGNLALPSKDRTGLFREPFRITEDTGKSLAAWLNSGVSAADLAARREIEFRAASERKAFGDFMLQRHKGDTGAILRELSSFFGREVASGGDLTADEVRDFMSVARQATQEPPQDAVMEGVNGEC